MNFLLSKLTGKDKEEEKLDSKESITANIKKEVETRINRAKLNSITNTKAALNEYKRIESQLLIYIHNLNERPPGDEKNEIDIEMEACLYSNLHHSFKKHKNGLGEELQKSIEAKCEMAVKLIRDKSEFMKLKEIEMIIERASSGEDFQKQISAIIEFFMIMISVSIEEELQIDSLPNFLLKNTKDVIAPEVNKSLNLFINLRVIVEKAYQSNENYRLYSSYKDSVAANYVRIFSSDFFNYNICNTAIFLAYVANRAYIDGSTINLSVFSVIFNKFHQIGADIREDQLFKLANSSIQIDNALSIFKAYVACSYEKCRFFKFSLYFAVVNSNFTIGSRERKIFYNTINYLNIADDSYMNGLLEKVFVEESSKTESDVQFPLDFNKMSELVSSHLKNAHTTRVINQITYSTEEKSSSTAINYLNLGIKLYSSLKQKNEGKQVSNSKMQIIPQATYILNTKVHNASPVVTLLISGFLSQEDNQLDTWNEVLNLDNHLSDVYLLNWQASKYTDFGFNLIEFTLDSLIKLKSADSGATDYNVESYMKKTNEFVTAKERSKLIGKHLAYLIASRTLFKGKLINLVGFSLGSNLIKHCLKELAQISRLCDYSCLNIINNITTIAGATQINFNKKTEAEILDVIGGKWTNVWSSSDMVLSYLFKVSVKREEKAVGIGPLPLHSKLEIVNFDYSDQRVGHTHYRGIMKEVFNKVRILEIS